MTKAIWSLQLYMISSLSSACDDSSSRNKKPTKTQYIFPFWSSWQLSVPHYIKFWLVVSDICAHIYFMKNHVRSVQWDFQKGKKKESNLACENIRFSSLFTAGDVSHRGTCATQRQKFHTDDTNQCLLNKSGSRGVPNVNLFNFRFLLIDFGKVLRSSANEL